MAYNSQRNNYRGVCPGRITRRCFCQTQSAGGGFVDPGFSNSRDTPPPPRGRRGISCKRGDSCMYAYKKCPLIILCLLSMFLTSCDVFGGNPTPNQPQQLVKAAPKYQVYSAPQEG